MRGRRLASPPRRSAGTVRPTSDRAREALFSSLGDVGGARVLDLFCGTGALAIEALSRGAASAVLVDTKPELARRNVDDLGLGDRCEVVRADALRYLERTGERFDLVLCDPPYRFAPRLGPELDRLLADRLEPGGRVVVESAVREPLELKLPLLRQREYGEALIRIHGKQ
ncbi:MAG TPA: RsmD family RNA methyltransferase [Solirubrobacterales bacterium]|nr:RsmD family RNA methyltransferase [Solirubrobacterales bacterium]